MKRGTTTFLKLAIIIIGIVILILFIFWFPWLARNAAEMNPEYAYLRYPVLVGIYFTAIPFYFTLYQALKLLNYIERKNAFSELAVDSLKHIKHCMIAISILYGLGLSFLGLRNALHPGIAVMGAAIIFAALTISFFAALLQELLRNALEIKSENDLTV